ncbi:unnamed protein product [Symbiodinium sp. CCMP2456]|nr:unnamed protein product [Symbiodinium sp. CCMP2456]
MSQSQHRLLNHRKQRAHLGVLLMDRLTRLDTFLLGSVDAPGQAVDGSVDASGHAFDGSADACENDLDALEPPKALLALDVHGVCGLSFDDTRHLLSELEAQMPRTVSLETLVLSYSGHQRGLQTRARLQIELPDLEVFICRGPVERLTDRTMAKCIALPLVLTAAEFLACEF